MKLNYNDILAAFRRANRKSLSSRELMASLKLPSAAKRGLHVRLREMERQRILKRIRGGRYELVTDAQTREGVIRLGRRGDGLVDQADGKNVRISVRHLGGALDGDRVRYALLRRDRNNRLNGRVVEIIERSGQILVGQFQTGRDENFILPVDMSFRQPILVDCNMLQKPKPGDWVAVRLDPHIGKPTNPRGELIEVLGDPSNPQVEMMASACRHTIPLHFSAAVKEAAEQIPDPGEGDDLSGRTDLRHLSFVTIDGETARDFDDAVALLPEGKSSRLFVAIADVSHYVLTGGIIDQAARERGTSVYFPGFCLPMLPEKLSNDICSLKPDVDRLVMVAEMVFDQSGHRQTADFYPAIIRSRARLTYNKVQSFLGGAESGPGDCPEDCLEQLRPMLGLSQLLTSRRLQRGSFELEIPEPEIHLDDTGNPQRIALAERFDAHRIVEEFMLAANEAVADFLAGRESVFPYRIHETPDHSDFTGLNNFLAAYGRKEISSEPEHQSEIQRLLQNLEDELQKRIVSRLILQSMKQARYSVDNVGHYGLAAERYCHFTSPIRRYPDLLVHRVLKQVLSGVSSSPGKKDISRLAENSSRRERLAIDAERDVQAMLVCRFMNDKVGGDYSGTISSVQKFGFFVVLDDFPVEGLVHIASLEDDFYCFDPELSRLIGERTGQVFAIGKSVKISVENVNITRREIDFRLISSRTQVQSAPARKRGRRQKGWR